MLRREVRYALRVLRRNPGFTAAAILTLALGIGANTALFSVFDALLLKPLPVADPSGLVVLGARNNLGERNREFSYPVFTELQARTRTLTGLSAATSGEDRMQVRIPPASDTETFRIALVSRNFFDLLGVSPAAGTLLSADGSNQEPLAILSYRTWTTRFGRAPAAIGTTVFVLGVPFRISGIAAPGFFGHVVGEAPDLWLPADQQPLLWSGASYLDRTSVDWLMLFGRMQPGATRAHVQAELSSIVDGFAAQVKGTPRARGLPPGLVVEAMPGDKGFSPLRDRFVTPLRVLTVIVGMVLIVACVNVASLLTARNAAREMEIAIRLAIGARRGHLARQFVVETLILSVAGGAAGVLLGLWGTDSLLMLITDRNGILPLDVPADRRLLAFASLIAAVTGTVFGLMPVWRYTRRPDVRLTVGVRPGPRLAFGRALVIVQVALSLVLIAGALLFVRTLQNLRTLDAGFTRQQVLLARVDPLAAGYAPPQLPPLYERLRDEIRRVPGVQSVSQSGVGLMSGRSRTCCFAVDGYTAADGERMLLRTNDVTPGYFQTVGMTLLQGRTFSETDAATDPRPVIVNQAFVRKYFGGIAPVGRSIALGSKRFPIIGVVADARYDGLRLPADPLTFWPTSGDVWLQSIEVRAATDSRTIAGGIRRAIASVDPRLPVREMYTVEQLLDSDLAQERLMAHLSGSFGALVLGLACVGLYGLLAQLVVRRTNEIGIRMALGAERGDIVRLVLRETALLVVPGVALGLAAAFASTRLAAALLFDISPTDPLSMTIASICLVLSALPAAWFPAYRAATISPLAALKRE